MSPEPEVTSAKWNGVLPATIVMICALSTLFILARIAYSAGRAEEDKRHFFVNYREPDIEEFWIKMMMDHIVNSSENNDVLFQGDSAGRFGVDAKMFEKLTGLKAFNLGTDAWVGWAGYTFMFEQYLKKHPKPKVVVLCLSPWNVLERRTPDYYKYQNRIIWSYGTGGEDTRPFHSDPYAYYTIEGLRSCYGYLLPATDTYRGLHPLDNWLGADWLRGEFLARRGSVLLTGQWVDPPPLLQLSNDDIAPDALEYMRAIAAVTQEHDIILIIRLMPVLIGLGDLSGAAKDQMRILETEFSNVVISRPELLHYDPDLFFDRLHLNCDGAAIMTPFLAAEVTDRVRSRASNLGNH